MNLLFLGLFLVPSRVLCGQEHALWSLPVATLIPKGGEVKRMDIFEGGFLFLRRGAEEQRLVTSGSLAGITNTRIVIHT